MESNTLLICPDCNSSLISERLDTPWCECGWTSVKDQWDSLKLPERLRAQIEKDQKRAQKFAKNDADILSEENSFKKRWAWRFYFLFSILLSLPFFAFRVIFWVGFSSAILFSLFSGSKPLMIMMGLVASAVFLYQILLVREDRSLKGIILTPQSAPLLFREIEEVARQVNIRLPATLKVRLIMEANASLAEMFQWRRLRFEPVLTVGLLTLYAVNISELRAILAHEFAHLQNRDNMFLRFIRQALETLEDILKSYILYTLWVPGLLLQYLVWKYLQLLAWASRRAIRRQEYMADKTAALAYGKLNAMQALVKIYGVGLKYREYQPIMIQNIQNKFNQQDFYTQFVEQWEALTPKLREGIYARAMVEKHRIHDTHPTYRDRRNALATVENVARVEQNPTPALTLINAPHQYGLELTQQLFRFWRQRR